MILIRIILTRRLIIDNLSIHAVQILLKEIDCYYFELTQNNFVSMINYITYVYILQCSNLVNVILRFIDSISIMFNIFYILSMLQ